MSAKAHSSATDDDNTTTTAIVQYEGLYPSSKTPLPNLPSYDDTKAAGTDLLAGTDHPMHLHGYSFYVVGGGFGNFDRAKDAKRFNFVEPSLQNTIMVPKNCVNCTSCVTKINF
ncbi:hypothetical protein CUMW_046360 [Citrus unshiu]|nr:hypothetical protein CUMW_046360 [Citrus unshiu]